VPAGSRRAYHSPRRQQAARETRLAVLSAARQQFTRHGYAGTSLAAIAQSAGVSLATVKLVAGTKAQLLVATVQGVMRRDNPSLPLVEQPWWREMLGLRDPVRMLREFASIVCSGLERQAELFEVVWQAASSEPELAELDGRASLGRRDDVRQVADALSELGELRADLNVDAAADTIWALASPQMFRLLVGRRGWSAQRWQEWLVESLAVQLLEPPRPAATHRARRQVRLQKPGGSTKR
jgi:AcrR family transcriptional regulator